MGQDANPSPSTAACSYSSGLVLAPSRRGAAVLGALAMRRCCPLSPVLLVAQRTEELACAFS